MMVLIVDDNPIMRGLIRRVLEGFADEIRECANGAEALKAYHRHSPDLVLMDIEMPEMDGLTATRHLTTQCPAARVVVVSQHDEDAMRRAAFAAGACAFVPKEELVTLPSLLRQFLPGTAADSTNYH